jgi:RNA polymerase sigma factor (sigma-70 family)
MATNSMDADTRRADDDLERADDDFELAPEAEGSALDRWVRTYGRLIRSAVHKVGRGRLRGNEDDVEQRVYIALWRRLRSSPYAEQAIDSPASYVYRAAVRETVRMLREEFATSAAAAPSGEVAASDRTSVGWEENLHLRREVDTALSRLSLERRRAVQGHLAGFDVRELMELWGWSYQKARNLVARGMNDLRRELTARGLEP